MNLKSFIIYRTLELLLPYRYTENDTIFNQSKQEAIIKTMNPFDYGDRIRKPTDIWGYFNLPKRNPVELTEEEKVKFGSHVQLLPELPEGYTGYQCSNKRAARRAITPPMWAKAFYKANK